MTTHQSPLWQFALKAGIAACCSASIALAQVELAHTFVIDAFVRDHEERHWWVSADSSGNVYSLGSLVQPITGKRYTVHVEKVSPEGNPIWESVFVAPLNHTATPRAITVDPAGDVYLTFDMRTSGSTGAPTIMRTIKLDGANGNTIWLNDWPATLVDQFLPFRLAAGSDGRLFLLYDLEGDLFLRCMDSSSGSVLWDVSADPGPSNRTYPQEMKLHPSGDVVIAGYYSPTGATGWRGFISRRLPLTGASLWTRIIDDSTDTALRGLDFDDSGDVYVTGHVTQSGGYPNIYTARLDGNSSAIEWSRTYDGGAASYDYGYDIAYTQSGSIFVLGSLTVPSSSANQFGVIKYALEGTFSWAYSSSWSTNVFPDRIGADPSGGVVCYGDVNAQGVAMMRFSGGSASPAWTWTDPNAGHGLLEKAPPPLFLPNGLVCLGTTVRSDSTALGWDSAIVACSTATGQEAWIASLQPEFSGDELVQSVWQFSDKSILTAYRSGRGAILSRTSLMGAQIWETRFFVERTEGVDFNAVEGTTGDAYVHGWANLIGSGTFTLTAARINAADGTYRWRVTTPYQFDYLAGGPTCIDPFGHVLVLASGNGDLFIVKLDRDTGSVHWSRTIPKSPGQIAKVGGIATDDAGDVYVLGTGPISSWAIHTFKLSGQTGQTLWATHHGTFPGAPSGTPNGLAIGRDGELYAGGQDNSRLYLWRLSRSSGTLSWQASYQQNPSWNHLVHKILVGPDGHPVVLAQVPPQGTSEMQHTVLKARSSDGAWIWTFADSLLTSNQGSAQLGIDSFNQAYYAFQPSFLSPYSIVGAIDGQSGQPFFRTEIPGAPNSRIALSVTPTGYLVLGKEVTNWGTGRDILLARFIQPIPVSPTSANVSTGNLISGNLASLLTSDDQRLQIAGAFNLDRSKPPASIVVEAVSPESSPSRMSFAVESHCTQNAIPQRIELFDFVSDSYVTLDTRALSTTDTLTTLDVANPTRYVAPSAQLMRAKISFLGGGPPGVRWRAAIDKVLWKVRE